jgi:NADH dehydrogenase (ubiquinone) 1 alpha subcomplex subunit 5
MLRTLAASLGPALRWEVPAAAALARGVKTTTGIVGLPMDPDARTHLTEKYLAVLEALHIIPDTAEYRLAVEKTVNYKLDLLNSDAVDEEVEDKLGRQLEEEIKMCDNELSLIPKMAGAAPPLGDCGENQA